MSDRFFLRDLWQMPDGEYRAMVRMWIDGDAADYLTLFVKKREDEKTWSIYHALSPQSDKPLKTKGMNLDGRIGLALNNVIVTSDVRVVGLTT